MEYQDCVEYLQSEAENLLVDRLDRDLFYNDLKPLLDMQRIHIISELHRGGAKFELFIDTESEIDDASEDESDGSEDEIIDYCEMRQFEYLISHEGQTTQDQFIEACRTGQSVEVKLLLRNSESNNIDVNARDIQGNTPLHLAIIQGNNDVIKALIPVADLNARNKRDETPVHYAFKLCGAKVIDFLLKHIKDFNFNQRDFQGKTVLELSTQRGEQGNKWLEIISQLQSRSEEVIEKPYNSSNRDLIIELRKVLFPRFLQNVCKIFLKYWLKMRNILWAKGPPVKNITGIAKECKLPKKTQTQKTSDQISFHTACRKGEFNIVRRMLDNPQDYNIDVNGQDLKGYTCLHSALINGRRDIIGLLVPLSDFSIKNSLGNNALHIACHYGSAKTVELILLDSLNSYGKDLNVQEQNTKGETAFAIAKSRKHVEIQTLLELHNNLQAPKVENSHILSASMASERPNNEQARLNLNVRRPSLFRRLLRILLCCSNLH